MLEVNQGNVVNIGTGQDSTIVSVMPLRTIGNVLRSPMSWLQLFGVGGRNLLWRGHREAIGHSRQGALKVCGGSIIACHVAWFEPSGRQNTPLTGGKNVTPLCANSWTPWNPTTVGYSNRLMYRIIGTKLPRIDLGKVLDTTRKNGVATEPIWAFIGRSGDLCSLSRSFIDKYVEAAVSRRNGMF